MVHGLGRRVAGAPGSPSIAERTATPDRQRGAGRQNRDGAADAREVHASNLSERVGIRRVR